jgi:23S rRNA (adenine2503-C2)-methyltransferase
MTFVPLLGQSLQDLKNWAVDRQQPAYRGQQIHDWIYNKGVRSLQDISVLPKAWRTEIQDYPIGRSHIAEQFVSVDGTVKVLLRLADDHMIETVGIPADKRLTVCVSSQVGCPMACDFCATGKGGYRRNLDIHEILDQVLTIQGIFQQRVSHIVFMGMGEPLLNRQAVVQSILRLNQDIGIGQRHMTLSTVGVPHQIEQLAQENLQVTLAVSLHAPTQALREQLIPSARHYALTQLLQDCQKYRQLTGRRISFEYTLLGGINDQPHHAHALADLLLAEANFHPHVNLIPYNPIVGADYQRPQPDAIRRFTALLKSREITVSLRQTRGLDQEAACGQLRGSFLARQPMTPFAKI